MHKLFFSYSHKDEDVRDELEIHLAMLKRQGVIDAWHDRRIASGSEIDNAISSELENSDIILLLVSPYFLASEYCYDIEMQRAMEMHSNNEARVIPIIVDPCDWYQAPFGKLLAAPRDGKPISKHANQHDAYLDITTLIRQAIQDSKPKKDTFKKVEHPSSQAPRLVSKLPRSSNLRVKKDFTEQQKDDFVEEGFNYIANYFEGSVNELCSRNPEITSRFRRVDANHFTVVLYRDGNSLSQCKIWMGGSFGEISYSSSISSSDNSMNDSLSVETDGHVMYFRPFGMAFTGRNESEQLTYEGAAEYFWEQLIRPLQ